MKTTLRIIAALGLAAVVSFVGIKYLNQTPESQILKPLPAPAKPKRFVIFNKNSFMRGKQARTMDVRSFTSMGAKNVQQMELINGATFEADDNKAAQIKSLAVMGDEWIVQEEVEYAILPWACTCQNCQPADPSPHPSPGPAPNPSPTPGPNPNPVDPVEPDRSWGRTRVHAKEAQALVDTSAVKICVIDTGIDMNHPNKGNVIGSTGFAGAVQDGNGHGTHTAGTVAGTGGVGISRGKLLICKGLSNSGSGSSSGLAQCLAWCGQQGAQIVSNSWGAPVADQLINQTIQQQLTSRGTYVFVANGNDSGPVNWPAKLAGSNSFVYAVAASDQRDGIAQFSSRGPETRFIAPGVSIVSNWPGGGTRTLDGTSMATPHAAAVCAFGIARGKKPCITPVGIGLSPAEQGAGLSDALATAQ